MALSVWLLLGSTNGAVCLGSVWWGATLNCVLFCTPSSSKGFPTSTNFLYRKGKTAALLRFCSHQLSYSQTRWWLAMLVACACELTMPTVLANGSLRKVSWVLAGNVPNMWSCLLSTSSIDVDVQVVISQCRLKQGGLLWILPSQARQSATLH